MAYGLRVWDSNGTLTLDTTDRVLRLISTHSYSFGSSNSAINISVPGFTDDGTWFAVTLAGTHWVTYGSGKVTVKRQAEYGGSSGKVLIYRG